MIEIPDPETIKNMPKFLLNEEGTLEPSICSSCGARWWTKRTIDNFICGVCSKFEDIK